MIRHLRHADIDKGQWDSMLLRCSRRTWYAQSWVLDRACPGWEALSDDETGAIMPLTCRRKWGVDYLFQPFGLQKLGVFATQHSTDLTDRFLAAVPNRFKYWDIMIDGSERPALLPSLRFEERTNQVLLLDRDIERTRADYSQGHRRNLKKLIGPTGFIGMPPASFIEIFRGTTGERFGAAAVRGLDDFQHVISEGVARGQCEIVAFVMDRTVLGAICFATWEGRTILLKSANTAKGLEAKAVFRIVDHWIAQHAGTGIILDFAGSMTPSVARFNAGFGAGTEVYLRLVRNLLPAPLRWLKR